jgi:hypothetical protein
MVGHKAKCYELNKKLSRLPLNLRQPDCLRLAGAPKVVGKVNGVSDVVKFKKIVDKAEAVIVVEKYILLLDASIIDVIDLPRNELDNPHRGQYTILGNQVA